MGRNTRANSQGPKNERLCHKEEEEMTRQKSRPPKEKKSKRRGLVVDRDMHMWLGRQDWSSFAQSLSNFYYKTGGLTQKQYESAVKMRMSVDKFYDPYGDNIVDGVYISERNYIYKLTTAPEDDFGFAKRSLRGRRIDSPSWSEIKGSGQIGFYTGVNDGTKRLLSDDELVQIGRDTGICCVCGKVLDNPKSIAAGIGPHCAKVWNIR
jgi:hypothetical protein